MAQSLSEAFMIKYTQQKESIKLEPATGLQPLIAIPPWPLTFATPTLHLKLQNKDAELAGYVGRVPKQSDDAGNQQDLI